MRLEPLHERFGTILSAPTAGTPLTELSLDEVRRVFRETGAILLRGFEADGDRFRAFADSLGETAIVNRSYEQRDNVTEDGTTQTVNKGTYLSPPHSEAGWSPMKPEVLWFFCVKPPASGGETYLCDGRHIWDTLPASLKTPLLAQRVKYVHEVPLKNLPFLGLPADLALAQEIVRAIPAVKVHGLDAERVILEYFVDAREKPVDFTLFVITMITFARLIRISTTPGVDSTVKEERLRFEDDSVLPLAIRDGLMDHSLACAYDVAWHPGELLMVDNYRMLHGRRSFEGDRQVYVRMYAQLR